ncbi:MAG: FHA domain-containing protein [Anaerolineaceae bacterium]|nr:MAG: FHA domain-containing protein [Anaerolineaceae bacterium]
MKLCPYCGHKNLEGVLFCEECGDNLSDALDSTLPTRRFEDALSEFSAKATWGSASVGQIRSVVIHFRNTDNPLVVELAERIVFGRADTSSTRQPDVDLTPYGALEKGVSRIHAAIERSDDVLTLVDVGSSNGTNLNGQRLAPDQPRVLRDGDEIHFGKLIAHFYFR